MKQKTKDTSADSAFEKTPEFHNFQNEMHKLLKVSKKELDERVALHAKNSPRKRSNTPGTQKKV